MNGYNYEIVWLSHGGPGSGRYPKGSGKKNEIRKKYLDLHASGSKELENIGVYTKRHANYAAKVESKYGKDLLKAKGINISNTINGTRFAKRPRAYGKFLKEYDISEEKEKELKRLNKLSKEEHAYGPGLYRDQKSIQSIIEDAYGEGPSLNGKWVNITPKDAVKIANKALKSDKPYYEIAEKYVHNKAIKKTVTRLLAIFGAAAGLGVLEGLLSVKD